MITVVGAGLAGAACATALRDAGAEVRLVDRGRAPGGRMSSPELHGRRVDLGAAYLTVTDPAFGEAVEGWGARPWTEVVDGQRGTGPVRWSAPGGLRSLVRAALGGMPVESGVELDALPGDGPVVLAMPDPQAARLVEVPDPVGYDPVIAVALGYRSRDWSFAARFVNDDRAVTFVADDGDRRGDGAPVLVAHTTPELARRHLADPGGAVPAVVGALGLGDPEWAHAHRWTFAKPAAKHDAPFGRAGDRVWLCGDQWCPDGAPRVESAWRSGRAAAAALLRAGPA